MRYVTQAGVEKHRLTGEFEACGNISKTGSVLGMQKLFGWPKGGQVRKGAFIYNVGPLAVDRMRGLGIVKGD